MPLKIADPIIQIFKLQTLQCRCLRPIMHIFKISHPIMQMSLKLQTVMQTPLSIEDLIMRTHFSICIIGEEMMSNL